MIRHAKIHYIMPMAGRGSRFIKKDFDCPKPLIEIYGEPFFYWAARSVCKFVELASLDFVILKEHVDQYHLDEAIIKSFPEARIHILPEVTKGAVNTCLEGITQIDDDLPVVFNDCDHLFRSDGFNLFCNENFDQTVDGILMTFPSDEPKFSFVQKDNNGNVVKTVEKEAVSKEAICGCYYFRNKNIFVAAAKQYLDTCSYTEYYMSGVYNVMLQNSLRVKNIPTDFHVPFGTPREYEEAKTSKRYEELME